jgi:hypothetical protein
LEESEKKMMKKMEEEKKNKQTHIRALASISGSFLTLFARS